MLKLDFPLVMAHVKASWENPTKDPMDELQGKFPNHKLMFALGTIYPKFWFENPNLDSIGVWLLSRLPITSPTRWEKMGYGWINLEGGF